VANDDINHTREETAEDGEDIPSMPFCDVLRVNGVMQFAMVVFFIKFA
jgi:hypothetical protein